MSDQPVSVTLTLGNKTITLETGRLARLAHGAVTGRIEDTMLLSAVTCSDEPREGIDYFPLQVEYREKYYAAGRFPGGFYKREARPTEREVLTARMTDRPLRPLFPAGYRHEVQVNNMLLSADGDNDPDVINVTAASAALSLSEIPFLGPIGCVRVGRIQGRFILFPTHAEREQSDLDLVYAGTRELPIMIEGSAREVAEADLVAAMHTAHEACVRLIDAQIELRRKAGLPDKTVSLSPPDTSLLDAADRLAGSALEPALRIADRRERMRRTGEIREALEARLREQAPELSEEAFRDLFDTLTIRVVRRLVLEKSVRLDGRGPDDIRPMAAAVGLLPRTHGSAVFQRAETQALGTVTLGTRMDVQELDAVAGGAEEKRFMVHYNMPPYSTGEVGRLGATGRREIGHGALAERSLAPLMPPDYPYTVRLVSDIMGSNGSTSMASVCVGSLALMDAGVPIRRAVAGISIGLMSGAGRDVLLTDILGVEDHCGDMDFKVAGTRLGVTGFQVDLKIHGLRWDLVEGAFEKARQARLRILDVMDAVLASPRPDLSPYAPRIRTLHIAVDKIGDLIGPGGKTIRRITEISGAQIDVEDDGTINIFAVSPESMEIAAREVSAIAAEVEEGAVYQGTVTGVKDFGAFVEVLPGKEGLVHISELADFRVRRVEDVCKVGDQIWVKCIGIDERGRVKLSRRAAMQELHAREQEKR